MKTLASQTGAATQEIASRIGTMQGTVDRSVVAIQAVSARIRELDGVVNGISAAVEEQAVATGDIAANVASAAGSVGHVEKSVIEIETLADTNTRAVSEMSAAANQLASQTRVIRERVRAFTREIERARA